MQERHRPNSVRGEGNGQAHDAAERREHPRAPGLHFVGYQVTLGGAFRLAGIQAKQLARASAT